VGDAIAGGGGEREIRCLVAFLRGFAFSQGAGTIFVFEADNTMVYRRKNVFVVPPMDVENLFDHDLTIIRCLSISPSMERMVVATDRSQLYTSLLWKANGGQGDRVVNFQAFSTPCVTPFVKPCEAGHKAFNLK